MFEIVVIFQNSNTLVFLLRVKIEIWKLTKYILGVKLFFNDVENSILKNHVIERFRYKNYDSTIMIIGSFT